MPTGLYLHTMNKIYYFLRLIALVIVAVGPKVLFERAIDSFDLTVCRGVMAGHEVKSHGEERSERAEKVGREF